MEIEDNPEMLRRRILRAMQANGLTFASLAARLGLSPFIVTASLLGQMSLPK